MIFEGENPPAAALIDYWLRDEGADVTLTVHDMAGKQVASVRPTSRRGVNRVQWDLRYSVQEGDLPQSGGFRRAPGGPLVEPGLYTVRLVVAGSTAEQVVRVKDDPRFDVDPGVRTRWTQELREITAVLTAAQRTAQEVRQAARSLDEGEAQAPANAAAKVRDLDREFSELVSRLARLRGSAEGWVGPLSADQAAQKDFLSDLLPTLAAEWNCGAGPGAITLENTEGETVPVYDSQKEGIVVITVDGDHTTAELKRVGAAALDRPGVPSPARVLLDVSGAASLKNRSPEDLQDTATFFADLPGLTGRGRSCPRRSFLQPHANGDDVLPGQRNAGKRLPKQAGSHGVAQGARGVT